MSAIAYLPGLHRSAHVEVSASLSAHHIPDWELHMSAWYALIDAQSNVFALSKDAALLIAATGYKVCLPCLV